MPVHKKLRKKIERAREFLDQLPSKDRPSLRELVELVKELRQKPVKRKLGRILPSTKLRLTPTRATPTPIPAPSPPRATPTPTPSPKIRKKARRTFERREPLSPLPRAQEPIPTLAPSQFAPIPTRGPRRPRSR